MQLTPEERDWLALHLVPGIGPKLSAALLRRFGTSAAVAAASPGELLEIPHLPAATAEALKNSLGSRDVDAELSLMEAHQVRLIRLGTPEYPPALATISVPPRFLYVRGSLEKTAHAIAIVGSRQCTTYGRRIAERLAADLAQAGFTVVSGLARGIDACAHRGALAAHGRTLAVLAGGLSRIYPPEHAELAAEVAASGALITESAMRMEPMAGMFPARNRIIDDLQRKIWDGLNESRTVDDLARHVELSTAALSGVLMTLELKKVIRRLPGNMYERY